MKQFNMFIDGQSINMSSKLDIINPATGQAFAQCPNGTPANVDNAVSSARRAFKLWGQTSSEERKQKIHQLADTIEANMPELMTLITQETGKPINGLSGVGSGMEVGGAIAWTRSTAELDIPIDVIQDNKDARIEVHRKPLGVVASITPWNWPLMIAIWHVIPALKAGNTVVIKPSELTPLATIRFVELANEILPHGVLNIVTGGSAVGTALCAHSGVDKIVFTGSTATGKKVMQTASATLKRLTLELGGNDAGIVLADVDIRSTAKKLFDACFHNNGQTCAALKRLYVHESIFDDVCDEMARLAREVNVGNGEQEDTELGPIQNAQQLNIVMDLAADAKLNGGHFLTGGKKIIGAGYFFEPTIVTGLTDGSRLVDEEPFGPILPIIKYTDIEEVIARANLNQSGLGGSVWSKDIAKATHIASRLECGSVWVNTHGALQPNAPFGGIKQSGFGIEFGLQGLAEFTSIQTIKINK